MDYKKLIFIGAVFIVLVIIGIFQGGLSLFKNPEVLVKGQTFSLSVAKTDEEKQIGLSKHQSIKDNEGMIFVFDKPAYYSFWMKDMKFPIDILYINEEKIVTIYEDQKPTSGGTPPVLSPTEPADKVLEIKAGLSKKHGIKVGDVVAFKDL